MWSRSIFQKAEMLNCGLNQLDPGKVERIYLRALSEPGLIRILCFSGMGGRGGR